jgi:hypothetical protein
MEQKYFGIIGCVLAISLLFLRGQRPQTEVEIVASVLRRALVERMGMEMYFCNEKNCNNLSEHECQRASDFTINVGRVKQAHVSYPESNLFLSMPIKYRLNE